MPATELAAEHVRDGFLTLPEEQPTDIEKLGLLAQGGGKVVGSDRPAERAQRVDGELDVRDERCRLLVHPFGGEFAQLGKQLVKSDLVEVH